MGVEKKKISLRVLFGSALILCCFVTLIASVSLQYYFARQAELKHTLTSYQELASELSNYLSQLQLSAEQTVRSGVQFVKVLDTTEPTAQLIIGFSELLKHDARLHSMFVANEHNDFFQLVHLNDADLRARVEANDIDQWMLITHKGSKNDRYKTIRYLADDFSVTRTHTEFSNFLATQRSWYENAADSTVFNSSPYLFHTLKVTGETYSLKVEGMSAVVGVDVLLSSLEGRIKERLLDGKDISEIEAFIYQEDGRLIATNRNIDIVEDLPIVPGLELTPEQVQLINNTPELKISSQNDWGPLDFSVGGQPHGFTIDLFSIVSEMTGLKFRFVNGRSWDQLVSDFKVGNIDILQSITKEGAELLGIDTQSKLFHANYAFVVNESDDDSISLDNLRGKKLALVKGWSITELIKQHYPSIELLEYGSLHKAIDALRENQIDAILDIRPVIKGKLGERGSVGLKLIESSAPILSGDFQFVVSQEHAEVFEIIKLALDSISVKERNYIRDKWRNQNTQPSLTYAPYRELLEYAQRSEDEGMIYELDLNGISNYLFVTQLTKTTPEYLAILIPKSIVLLTVNEQIAYSTVASMMLLALLVPAAWWFATPISLPIKRLTQSVTKIAQRDYTAEQKHDYAIKELHGLSEATNSMSSEIQKYEKQQNEFFDSMIQLVAGSIDEKSAYTAGHCNRVPEIALMLVEEAEKVKTGEFKSFKFNSNAERREFRIAAWLHDCGKIATPEFVVDKGTKLETNYNRIHEIRTRFEVLWRDIQIAYLLDKVDEDCDLNEELKADFEILQNDFAFIAKMNKGAEFSSDADLARLEELAKVKWTRTFDRSLGLSPLEETREVEQQTPMVETLLMDLPEHEIERERPFDLDPKLNITMKVPELLYNHGELYNLSVRSGTLSQEERFKINEHMIGGIKMLDSIPFPPELSKVPRYATTHHERMDGKGYPRSLDGKTLSIPEKLLAVSDVFEALVASDRPYKKAKPLSEAISIMSKMVAGGHLDKASFELLLESGVYLEYAKIHLSDEQIDEVDITQYLSNKTDS